jgi:hypothetical protein
MVIWYIFHVLVYWTKKNLATLPVSIMMKVFAQIETDSEKPLHSFPSKRSKHFCLVYVCKRYARKYVRMYVCMHVRKYYALFTQGATRTHDLFAYGDRVSCVIGCRVAQI